MAVKKAAQKPEAKSGPSTRPAITPKEGTPAVQRVVGADIDLQGPIPPGVVLTLQQLLGNQVVRALLGLGPVDLDPDAAAADAASGEGAKLEFNQQVIDEIVSETIAETLEAYNNIPVVIKEERPLPEAAATASAESTETAAQGESAAAAPTSETITKKLKVRAVYYINSGSETIKDARKAAGFGAIVGALGDQLSELTGKNGRLSAGNAVKYGKASPEDLGLFVNKALAEGSVHKYGRQQGKLAEGQQLVDLGDEELKGLIQDWMYYVRSGVDCTGLVNIALIRAREKVREQMRAAGVPEEEIPRSLARKQRPHKGKKVTKPTELRPGDIWVTNSGAHVRVVMEAYEGTDPKDRPVIEFKTAESATGKALGPTDKTWRTQSLTKIQNIRNISGKGSTDGEFFRVKEVRK